MENDAIASELKLVLLYREDSRNEGAVTKIASILGLAKRTIYDYLDGRIKINLPFLHACVIATNGDPDIKKFLEPVGWMLIPRGEHHPDKCTLAEECLDDVPALAEFHRVLNDPASTLTKITRAKTDLINEIMENIEAWKTIRKK